MTPERDERPAVAARDRKQQLLDDVGRTAFNDDNPREFLAGLRRKVADTRSLSGAVVPA